MFVYSAPSYETEPAYIELKSQEETLRGELETLQGKISEMDQKIRTAINSIMSVSIILIIAFFFSLFSPSSLKGNYLIFVLFSPLLSSATLYYEQGETGTTAEYENRKTGNYPTRNGRT